MATVEDGARGFVVRGHTHLEPDAHAHALRDSNIYIYIYINRRSRRAKAWGLPLARSGSGVGCLSPVSLSLAARRTPEETETVKTERVITAAHSRVTVPRKTMKFSRWMFGVDPAETIQDTGWRSPKLRVELMHLSANRLISIPHGGVRGCVCHDRLSSYHDPQRRFSSGTPVSLSTNTCPHDDSNPDDQTGSHLMRFFIGILFKCSLAVFTDPSVASTDPLKEKSPHNK